MKYTLKYLIKCWGSHTRYPDELGFPRQTNFKLLMNSWSKWYVKTMGIHIWYLESMWTISWLVSLNWGSQTLAISLMKHRWAYTLPTKETKLYIDIFLVFWLVNNEKQSMIQSNVLGYLSQCKPNECGGKEDAKVWSKVNAYDEITWGILGLKLGYYSVT